jgi:hypothetical protein
MITEIIKLLNSNNFFHVGEEVEIVKGKNKIIKSWRCVNQKIIRKILWQLKKR